jgi:hypothetical protein
MEKKKKVTRVDGLASTVKAAGPDGDFCVPEGYLDRAAFAVSVLPTMQGDDSVFFEKVLVKGNKKGVCLCVCAEGVLTLERKGATTMLAFHHLSVIRNFIAPPQGSTTYEKDPAGYVVVQSDKSLQTVLFRFETPQERHLFLNIVTRFASEHVELNRLKRTRAVYSDRQASPGLHGNASESVIKAIRERRARCDASSPARKALKFAADDVIVEEALQATRARALTR